jgi:type IV fimbrial biogenesis protein FimT
MRQLQCHARIRSRGRCRQHLVTSRGGHRDGIGLHSARGISLLDLLIALAVTAILLTQAIPAFTHTVASADRAAAINALVSAIHLARNASVTRGEDVVLCKSTTGEDCERGPSSSWTGGAMVFVNRDQDEPPRVDVGEPVLLVQARAPGVQVDANREAFVLRPFERRSTNGTLVVCDRRGSRHARAVIVSWTGRPRVAPTRPDGTPLECEDDDQR